MAIRNVLLAGRSLLLSAVATCLADAPDVCLTQAASLAEASVTLSADGPAVLICDISEKANPSLLAILANHPQLCLIGLDPEFNRAVVLSGREVHALTLQGIRDMVAAIDAPHL